MATDLYVRLSYDEYKTLERQLKDFENLETTHQSMGDERFYHKSLRVKLGDINLEVYGPTIKEVA